MRWLIVPAAGSWRRRLRVERRHRPASSRDHGRVQAGGEPRPPVLRQGGSQRDEPQAGGSGRAGAQVQRRHPARAAAAQRIRSRPFSRTSTPPTSGSHRCRASSPRPATGSAHRCGTPAAGGASPSGRRFGRRPAPGNHGARPAVQLARTRTTCAATSTWRFRASPNTRSGTRRPTSPTNARYWIGECYYSKKQFKEAIDAFTSCSTPTRHRTRRRAALLKKGFAYLELGDRSQAVINLQYVIYEHPGSKEAELARSRLPPSG